MDAAQWPQGIGIGIGIGVGVVRGSSSSVDECSRINPEKIKKPRAEKEQSLNCPRCKSTNTKFCYYNNYSLSQPRYFCKSCRRYWTAGGTLRNVPVGGTSRKNKSRRSSSSSTTKSSIPDLSCPPKLPPQNPNTHDGPHPHLKYLPYNDPPLDSGISELLPFTHLNPQNPNLDTGPGLSSLVFDPVSDPGFELGFSLENRFGNSQAAVQDDSNGFWSGMLSGGSW